MWNRDPARLRVVLELCVTALSGHFVPTVSLKGFDDFRTFHVYKYTLIQNFAIGLKVCIEDARQWIVQFSEKDYYDRRERTGSHLIDRIRVNGCL